MSKSDSEILTKLVSAFSAVIVETTRAIARNSNGKVRRDLIARDLQQHADKLPEDFGIAKRILGNISAGLDAKPFTPLVIQTQDE